jgi:hypothetical protein
MTRRRCLRCGQLVERGHDCRPSAARRGYDRDDQHRRAELETTLPAYCWYGCGRLLIADDDWVAAHVVDGDNSLPRVVSCRSCNERAKR